MINPDNNPYAMVRVSRRLSIFKFKYKRYMDKKKIKMASGNLADHTGQFKKNPAETITSLLKYF